MKADKAEADKSQAANNDQAKAVNNGGHFHDRDGTVTLVTREQKQEALKMW